MPSPTKNPANQTGHRTKTERAARMAATEGMKRKTRIRMSTPEWLSEDGLRIWQRIRNQVRGLELLDNLDADMLAIYCDTIAKYKQATMALVVIGEDGKPIANDEAIKSAQSWARLAAQYADKLGLSPAARARLAKRKADDILDNFGDEFDG